jgi:hypothetical protein
MSRSITPVETFDCGGGFERSAVDFLCAQAAEFLRRVVGGGQGKIGAFLTGWKEKRSYRERASEETECQTHKELPPHTRHPTKLKQMREIAGLLLHRQGFLSYLSKLILSAASRPS